MEKLLYMKTHVKNETRSVIKFDVDKRLFPRVVLQPGETLSVNTNLIHNHCKNNGKEWTIHVLINNEFTGIKVKPGHLICLVRLVFRYKCTTEEQISDICMEGTREKSIDRLLRVRWIGHLFGRNTKWEKRDYSQIAEAKRRQTVFSEGDIDNTIDLVVRSDEEQRREVISTEQSNDNVVGGVQAINQLVAPLARNDKNLPQRQTAFSGGDICDKTSSVVPPEEEQVKEMLSQERSNNVCSVEFTAQNVAPLAEVMITEQSSYVVPQGSTMANSSVPKHTINFPNQLIFVLSLGLIVVFTRMLLSWV